MGLQFGPVHPDPQPGQPGRDLGVELGADAPADPEDLWTDGVAGHLGSTLRDREPVVVPLEPGSAGHGIRQVGLDLGPPELRPATARHLPA